eukprot:TRINITY_DN27037_c0_g1_i1.p1 TRINITY_DN27037_c0_g1~~TRINITY_DN27037_c0_g1_i1.p1  ORF type:complete len:253 (+),score=49.02 TRINITY_DN27037_c0_g1_i1:57-815(+)
MPKVRRLRRPISAGDAAALILRLRADGDREAGVGRILQSYAMDNRKFSRIVRELAARWRNSETAAAVSVEALRQYREADDWSVNTVLAVCAQAGASGQAAEVLALVKARKGSVDRFCVTSAISACRLRSEVSLALRLLRDYPTSDPAAFSAAVEVCTRAADVSAALGLRDELRRVGGDMQPSLYVSLLSACAVGRLSGRALQLLAEYRRSSAPLSNAVFNASFAALRDQSGSVERVLAALRRTLHVRRPPRR